MYISDEAEAAVRVYEQTAIQHAERSRCALDETEKSMHRLLSSIAATTAGMMKLYQMTAYLGKKAYNTPPDELRREKLDLAKRLATEDLTLRDHIKFVCGDTASTSDCQDEHMFDPVWAVHSGKLQ